jgi:hypothetical protein
VEDPHRQVQVQFVQLGNYRLDCPAMRQVIFPGALRFLLSAVLSGIAIPLSQT